MTSVFDCMTSTYTDYTLPPREAVVAAYAQLEQKDFNTWDYPHKYGHLVRVGNSIKPGFLLVTCGNQAALEGETTK